MHQPRGLANYCRGYGADQFDPIVGCARQEGFARAIGRIHQMFFGEEGALGEGAMHLGDGHRITLGGHRRLDMGHEVGPISITGFGQVNFLPHPGHAPFGAVACFGSVRRGEAFRRRWYVICVAPVELSHRQTILLGPDLLERGHCGDALQPVRVARCLNAQQQMLTILSDLLSSAPLRRADRLPLWKSARLPAVCCNAQTGRTLQHA